jgi:hypothetical protein
MTKRWGSSTASGDGKTKRQASKDHRRAFAKVLKRIEAERPEGKFTNAEDMLAWLNDEKH